MLTPRRLFGLLFFSVLTLSSFAQSASMDDPRAEKITLNEAIQRALARNYAIKLVGFDSSIASAQVTQALGKFDPVLSGSYTYSESLLPSLADPLTGFRPAGTFTKTDSADFGLGGLLPWGMTYKLDANSLNSRGTFNGYVDNFDTFAGVSGTQPLLRNFGFGPTLASIRIAQVNRNISQWQFRQTAIDTISLVIFAYHDLNFAYAALRSAVRSKELAVQLLEENRKRFKVGSVSEYDVTSAEARAAAREDGLLQAQNRVVDAENALKRLISDGKPTDLLTHRLTIEPPAPAPIVMVDAVTDFGTALQKRPDYQEFKLAVKRDGINTRLQFNQMLPRVDLVGSYGYNGYDTDLRTSRQQIKNEDYRAYSWGVVVSVPLTFTTERGRYRAAKLQQRRSETALQQAEQDIVVSVGNAANDIETNQKRVQATRRARELAQATLDDEEKRFRAGTSTTLFVAQQQEQVSGAEVSEAQAQAAYAKSLAEYDRQLGVTLEKLGISIEPPK